ncbi:protein NRT1/ PTR FAMILY 5.10-like [Rhododendron vialii]|uniref:protein NRT1/ PTR FAMILY 5.10-like n=1 Tax=Rhododendron vialii TaxID=182163 RepID=UPI00265F42B8|nr:protein NRT1/ PTR FAMILY 5.10-like [Rhododendron vialii]
MEGKLDAHFVPSLRGRHDKRNLLPSFHCPLKVDQEVGEEKLTSIVPLFCLAYTQLFVNIAVVRILITYFTDTWKKHNVLPLAVAMVNLLRGLSSVLKVAMTYISDNRVSPLKVILSSVAAYIIGMVMLCISAFHPIPGDMTGLYFVPVVLLIAVGKAGGVPVLKGFLVGQLTAHEPRQLDIDEGRVNARKNVWWTIAWLLCGLSILFGSAGWRVKFMVSTLVMGIGYFLFLCCIPLYHHRSLDEAATTEIPRGASPEENTNNGLTSAVSPEISRGASPEENTNNGPTPTVSLEMLRGASSEENTNNGPNQAVSPEISRGASPEESTNNGTTLAVSAGRRLMEKWKPLFIMIPMWTSFLIFGLVLSTGDSFYTEQGRTMEPTVSIYILIMIWKMTECTSSSFSTRLLRTRKTKGITVGIWTAMLVSVICCYVAWHVEIRRLRAIAEYGLCVDQDSYVPLSIMHLAPQFCLLGLTEGIGREGLELFFKVQVSDVPMKIYGSALNEAVIGLGSFLNAILVFHFKSWFLDTLNCNSRLDKHYQLLTILSFANLCYYSGFVSIYYSNKNKTKDDLQVEAAGAG